jgi:hypothetical protein
VIGVKSISVIVLAACTTAIVAALGDFDGERFAHLSAGSAFAIGLFAALAGALVGWSARPEIESRIALAFQRGRPALVFEPQPGTVRELPPFAQQLLLVGVFACIALATFTNEATARIEAVPESLTKPSRAEYCHDEPTQAAPQAAPTIEAPVDQAGCALVKRAFALGYAKSLGTCAPKTVTVAAPVIAKAHEVCTRRQLDEPFSHYAWRRVVEAAAGASPIDSTSKRVDAFQTRLDYVPDLLADIKHSITGTPHASHHLWVTLPDPHASSWHDKLTGHVPCASVFADLPLWPRFTAETTPSELFEYVLGQLLFATRFGTPASCTDYTIHWGAAPDACSKLAADPVRFLDDEGALASIRAVLDRRARQLAIRKLTGELGHAPTVPMPPDARAVVSISCFAIDPATTGGAATRDVMLDGEPLALRELRAPAIQVTGRGLLDVYVQLAVLLGGKPYAGPSAASGDRVTAEPASGLDSDSFPLLRLEPLVDADPFLDRSVPIDRPEIVEVYPFEQHVFGFVDAFRRVYLPQRGRL